MYVLFIGCITMTETKTKTKKTSTTDIAVVVKYQQMIQFVKNTIHDVESDLKRAKIALQALEKFDPSNPSSLDTINQSDESQAVVLQSYVDEDTQIVEWLFDGYFMTWPDQKKYPVPLNYASKTKLVPGDVLKLKILADGKFVYKLIRPVERKHVRAVLSKTDDNKFIAVTDDGKTYFLNQAAVTFFKWKASDELYIVTNADGSGSFAAIEAIIKK